MSSELIFTQEESDTLDKAAVKVLDNPEVRFERLIATYRNLVSSLPYYDFSIYEYDNDIWARVAIDRVLQACHADLAEKVQIGLDGLDKDFVDGTVEVQRRFGASCEDCSYNWYSRLPRKPGDELQSDIDSGNV